MKKRLLACLMAFSLVMTSGMFVYAEENEHSSNIIQNEENVAIEIDNQSADEIPAEVPATSGMSLGDDLSWDDQYVQEDPEEPSTEVVPAEPSYQLENLPNDISVAEGANYQIQIPNLKIYNSVIDSLPASNISYTIISGWDMIWANNDGIVHGSLCRDGYAEIKVNYAYVNWNQVDTLWMEQVIRVYVTNPYPDETQYQFNFYGSKKLSDKTYDTGRYVEVGGINQFSKTVVTVSDKNLVIKEKKISNGVRRYYMNPKKKGVYSFVLNVDGREIYCNVELRYVYLKFNAKSVSSQKDKMWKDNDTVIALYPGESTRLYMIGRPAGYVVSWTSDDPSIVSVSSNGTIKGIRFGDTVITGQSGEYVFKYKVSVGPKSSIKALRYAAKHFNSTYSQKYRMSTGKYDCSSYVWRSYKDAGFYIGSRTYAPTAAGEAKWAASKGYMVYSGTVKIDDLIPGDLIFWTGADNGRYEGIYHVDIYVGNRKSITVPREKNYGDTITKCMVVRPNSSVEIQKPKLYYKNENDERTISLSWGSVFQATGYQVYRKEAEEPKYTKIATVDGATKFIDTDIEAEKTYYYVIRPYWYNELTESNRYGMYTSVLKKRVN